MCTCASNGMCLLKLQGHLVAEHVTRIARFAALFYLFDTWTKSVVQRMFHIEKALAMTLWCLTAPHPACVICLWFLCVDVSIHLPRWLNSAICSPVYRLAVRNAMTNSGDADFRFVARASSDACLWNCLLLKLGKLGWRLWSVLFFFLTCNEAPTSRSCVVFFRWQNLLKYVRPQFGVAAVVRLCLARDKICRTLCLKVTRNSRR